MKNFCIIWCVLFISSSLFGMEDFKKFINQRDHILLVKERDQRIKDNFCNKICNNNFYLGQHPCTALDQLIINEQTKDPEFFNNVSGPAQFTMTGSSGTHSPQTLVLGNNYNFGGWSAAAAFVAGIGIGYLWFGRNRAVL